VKSAVLLAGLLATGITRVREEHPSRNHTEIALAEFGARVGVHQGFVEVEGGAPLRGGAFTVPGDISSAAFLIAAAAGIPGSNLRLTGVGVNPTRSGFVSLLQRMGGRIRIEAAPASGGEPTADITVEGSNLTGLEVQGEWIPNIIDEIPILAVLATRTQNGIRIRDASELRSKESDRIAAIVRNLQALGVRVEEFPDGFFVPGPQALGGGIIDSFDDHRIAMAFAVAGLFAKEPVTIQGASCVDISFPGFFQAVERVYAA
jgi:3-phosphoshikimate 1-carboxyvinyltransferase